MRRALLAVLLLALAAPLSAQDDKKKDDSPLAPFNPFETAAVGDWLALSGTITEGDHEERKTDLMEVQEVAADEVKIAPITGKGEPRVFARKSAPKLVELVFAPKGSKVQDLVTKDEKRTIGGKELACKHVTFKVTGERKFAVDAWFCPDAKGTGCVALRIAGDDARTRKLVMEFEAVGWGTKEKSLFGISRAEAEKLAKGAKAEKPEKPEKAEKKKPPAKLADKVSIALSEVSMSTALEMVLVMGNVEGVKIEFAEGVDPNTKVTFSADDKTIADVFDMVVARAGYTWDAQGDTKIVVKKVR